MSGSATCWTQSLRGLWGFVSTPSWVPMWRTCPNWLWLVSQTSGTWWTLATKLGQCVLVLQYYIASHELFSLFTADAVVQNAGGRNDVYNNSRPTMSLCHFFKNFFSCCSAKSSVLKIEKIMKMITPCSSFVFTNGFVEIINFNVSNVMDLLVNCVMLKWICYLAVLEFVPLE